MDYRFENHKWDNVNGGIDIQAIELSGGFANRRLNFHVLSAMISPDFGDFALRYNYYQMFLKDWDTQPYISPRVYFMHFNQMDISDPQVMLGLSVAAGVKFYLFEGLALDFNSDFGLVASYFYPYSFIVSKLILNKFDSRYNNVATLINLGISYNFNKNIFGKK